MNLILLFIYLASLFILFYLAHQKTKINKTENEPREEYYDMDSLDRISDLKDDIRLLSDMIADVKSCDPGTLVRTVQVTIPEYGHKYEFLVDGQNEISDVFVNLFSAERDDINSSLRQEIQKIK